MQSFIKNNKSVSPRSLPKLQCLKPGRVLKEHSPEIGLYTSNSSNHLFLELERKLIEQQKEIMSRDTAVKKVIYNFENIIEAHNDQKTKIAEIKAKYLKAKKELTSLKETNSNLNEILAKGPGAYAREIEEKYKSQLETLNFQLHKKNSDLQDKQNLLFALETEINSLKRELHKAQNTTLNTKSENPATPSNPDLKPLLDENYELQKSLKNKAEELNIAHNQIIYFRESTNILNAELKTARYTINNLKKKYFKLKESSPDDENLRVPNKSLSRPPEDLSGQFLSASGSNFYDDHSDQPLDDKLKLLKEIQDLSEIVMKLRESEMLQNDRLRYLDRELASQKDLASSYKRKFEEVSVEIGLLNETIIYKDEKIKRDAERIKYYKSTEPELSIVRKTNKELEEACKHLSVKADKIFEASTVEKEKWLAKEQGYFETINGLVKEINALKNKEDYLPESSSLNRILEFENEVKNLRKELEKSLKMGEGLGERNKEMDTKLKHVVFLLNQADEILKCCSCYATGKALGLIVPCLHLICKECSGSKCKECYASVHSVVHPGFVDSFMYLLTQVKQYCKS